MCSSVRMCVYLCILQVSSFLPPPHLLPHQPLMSRTVKCILPPPAAVMIPNMKSNPNAVNIRVGNEFLTYFSGPNLIRQLWACGAVSLGEFSSCFRWEESSLIN